MEELRKETEKWLQKIKEERKKIVLADNSKGDFIKNIDSYISDSEHFLKNSMMHSNASHNSDLIRAFEAVIWAFAWLEIGKELEIIKNV
jgi:hypothetical protein